MERVGNNKPDRAHELQDAQGQPGFPRQGAKGRDVLAYLVEHEDLHDARRSVQERGEDLQDPQQDVHRVPLEHDCPSPAVANGGGSVSAPRGQALSTRSFAKPRRKQLRSLSPAHTAKPPGVTALSAWPIAILR